MRGNGAWLKPVAKVDAIAKEPAKAGTPYDETHESYGVPPLAAGPRGLLQQALVTRFGGLVCDKLAHQSPMQNSARDDAIAESPVIFSLRVKDGRLSFRNHEPQTDFLPARSSPPRRAFSPDLALGPVVRSNSR